MGHQHMAGPIPPVDVGKSRPHRVGVVRHLCLREEPPDLNGLEEGQQMDLDRAKFVRRVIARPFVGTGKGAFQRTSNRHDYSLEPPKPTMLDAIKAAGLDSIAVGKIHDIFAGKGDTEYVYNKSNADGMNHTSGYAAKDFHGLCFVNLVDFDMVFGHRRNIDGYANALSEFDAWLGEFQKNLGEDDLVMITADHGCDPSYTATTDHTREYVPLLVLGKQVKPGSLGTRASFADIAATVAELLDVQLDTPGESFAAEILP